MIHPLPGQLELPACDHDPSKLLLQRRANAPMRPTKHQKPMDIGLFDSTPKQIDLEDVLQDVCDEINAAFNWTEDNA